LVGKLPAPGWICCFVSRERITIVINPIRKVKLIQIQKRGCGAPVIITKTGNTGTKAFAHPWVTNPANVRFPERCRTQAKNQE
jgi:hypothetical protein